MCCSAVCSTPPCLLISWLCTWSWSSSASFTHGMNLLIALSDSDAPIISSNVRVSSQVFYNLSGALNESLSSSDSLPGNTRRRCSHHLLRNYNPSIIFSGSASSLQVLLQEMAVLAISPSGLQSSCVMWFARRFLSCTHGQTKMSSQKTTEGLAIQLGRSEDFSSFSGWELEEAV